MVEQDQVRPLAQTSDPLSIDDDETALHLKDIRRKKCIRCWSSVVAIFLIIIIVIIVLIFTVFRVRSPTIKLNGIKIIQFELINGTVPKPGVNISLSTDVSVKNPNFASFKYSNTSTTLYYHGILVGQAYGPPGHARAWRTIRMNATVDIITDKLLSSPNFSAEIGTGLLTTSTYSRIGGRVKIFKIIKKHVVVKMNCTFSFNLSSLAIQDQKCKRHVDL